MNSKDLIIYRSCASLTSVKLDHILREIVINQNSMAVIKVEGMGIYIKVSHIDDLQGEVNLKGIDTKSLIECINLIKKDTPRTFTTNLIYPIKEMDVNYLLKCEVDLIRSSLKE